MSALSLWNCRSWTASNGPKEYTSWMFLSRVCIMKTIAGKLPSKCGEP